MSRTLKKYFKDQNVSKQVFMDSFFFHQFYAKKYEFMIHQIVAIDMENIIFFLRFVVA